MNSSLIIKFNGEAQVGDIIQIQDSNTPTVTIDIQFQTGSPIQLPVSGNILLDIENVFNFLQNTYNATARYILIPNYLDNEIYLEDNIGGVSDFTETNNNTGGSIETIITNLPTTIDIKILSSVISENITDPCNLVDISIITNQQATNITSPVNEPVLTNPFTITDILRDSVNDILITLNDATSSDKQSIFVPKIESALFDLQIVKDPSSNTLNIIWLGAKQPYFNLTYSLDNITFYPSTSFGGLSEGNYTLYVKDDIGCSISIPFEITSFEPNVYTRESVFTISEQNSLIYKKRENIDGCTIFKNPTNTLSYEEETNTNTRDFKQLFQKCDGIRTEQLRSSYENATVNLIDCQGSETALVLEQKTANIGVTDVRDVTINSVSYLNSQFVGVTYVSGKTYDPDTLLENGSYYLGSSVPKFMNKGDYIQVEGAGWFLVKDVVFINQVQNLILDILTSSFPIPVTGQTVKGTSVRNINNYEVFEYDFDFNTLNGDYYIKIEATDSEFESVSYRTEWFNVKELQERTYVLQYYNTENNETNYSTGIRNKIRIPYAETLTFGSIDTQDVYLTDTSAVSIEADFRKGYTLNIIPAPESFIDKIIAASSNDRLFMNGLSLVKNAEAEPERVGVSNLYKLTMQYVRSDYNFNSVSDDGSIVIPEGDVLGTDDTTENVLGTEDI